MSKEAITASSGNVFADLGAAQPAEHRLKAALVRKLALVIERQNLTQTQAAKLTGISQPDLSKVLRGRFRDMSSDRLIRALTLLDTEIDMTFSHKGEKIGEPIHLAAA